MTTHVKGPRWKRIWKRHKAFLYHRSEMEKDLYCGRTCKDWCLIVSCVLTYYTFLALFWIGCFSLFMVIIINPSEPVVYRKGFIFANEKIKEDVYPIAYGLAKQAKKELYQMKMGGHLITQSHLDFPLLSLLPHRFDGGVDHSYTDDTAPGDVRNAQYERQMNGYWKKLLERTSGNIYQDEDRVGVERTIKVRLCSPENFYEDRMNIRDADSLLLNTACRSDDQTIRDIIDACSADAGGEMKWSYKTYKNSTGEPVDPDKPGDTKPIADFKPCFIAKLNNIVGMVPVPWKGEELKAMYNLTMTGNGTKVISFPSLQKLINETEDGQHKLPLACWLNIVPNSPESKNKANDLNYFFGRGNESTTDFLTFHPGPYIDLRQYPYMCNPAHPGIPTAIQIHYNNAIKEQDIISMDCRVFAKNIPYKYTLDTTPANKFGHVRVRMKYYKDKKVDSMNFWKLEK